MAAGDFEERLVQVIVKYLKMVPITMERSIFLDLDFLLYEWVAYSSTLMVMSNTAPMLWQIEVCVLHILELNSFRPLE